MSIVRISSRIFWMFDYWPIKYADKTFKWNYVQISPEKKSAKMHQLSWKRDFTFEKDRFAPEEKRGKKYPVILVRLIFAQNMRLPTKKNQHNFGLVGRSMRKLYCMCRFHYRPAKNSSRAVSILICMAFLMNCICRLLVCLPVPSLHDRIIQKFIVNFVYTCTKLSQPPKVNNHKLFQWAKSIN